MKDVSYSNLFIFEHTEVNIHYYYVFYCRCMYRLIFNLNFVFSINPGIQGSEHPQPGCHYNTPGFPRVAYLPDTSKGKKVCLNYFVFKSLRKCI